MEDHVDRKAKMGTRVLINDGWYKVIHPLGRHRFEARLRSDCVSACKIDPTSGVIGVQF